MSQRSLFDLIKQRDEKRLELEADMVAVAADASYAGVLLVAPFPETLDLTFLDGVCKCVPGEGSGKNRKRAKMCFECEEQERQSRARHLADRRRRQGEP